MIRRGLPYVFLAFLYGKRLTGFKWFSLANNIRNILALIPWNINTLFYRNIFTNRNRNKKFFCLWDILANIIGIGNTRARNNNPDLLITLPLPHVVTMLLLQGGALCLCVVLILLPVLLPALLLVGGVALLLHHLLTHSLVCVDTDLLVIYLTLLLIMLCTFLCVHIIVGGFPQSLVEYTTN